MTEPTDAELDELRQANSGRLNFVTLSEFRTIARAVLAKWGTPPAVAGEPVFAFRRKGLDDFCTCTEERYAELSAKPNLFETRIFYTTPQPTHARPVAREPLSDEEVDSLCKVGFVYVIDGKVTRTPTQYRDELKAAQRYGLRKGEHAHGIKGGQHGTESST
jgi:hypothetical protein